MLSIAARDRTVIRRRDCTNTDYIMVCVRILFFSTIDIFVVLLTVITCETVRFRNCLEHRVLFHGVRVESFIQPSKHLTVLNGLRGIRKCKEIEISHAVRVTLLVLSEIAKLINNL
jgi:hypothetical protein